MALADELESGISDLGAIAKMNTFKLAAAAVMVCGVGILRLADAISRKTTAAKEAANQMPAIAAPGQPEAK